MSGRSSPDSALVIGAGIGGLAASILLARQGWKVRLLEQSNRAGGKMQEIREKGFRFDTGPSLLTLPHLLLELLNGHEKLSIKRTDPLCRYFFPDGIRFDCYHDPLITAKEIERFAPEDRDAYLDFLAHAESLYEKTERAFLKNPLYEAGDLRHLKLTDLFRIDAFRSVSDRVDRSFHSPWMRQFFKRFSTYNGSSPYKAPGTLNVIPHVELTLGGYYVTGGLYRIAEALETVAKAEGVEFEYDCRVTEITVRNQRTTGVRLADGSVRASRLVLSNSDANQTLLSLVSPEHLPFWKRCLQSRIEPSSSGFVLLLGCHRCWDMLDHHNIFFSSNYRKEFSQIFDQHMPPDDPTIYVSNTSKSDPSDAPEGGANLFILVNVPWLSGDEEWGAEKNVYAGKLIRKLETMGLEGLSESIRVRHVITPVDFRDRYSTSHGSIYGSSSNGRCSAFLRPRNKVREIDGLYMVGGSTHPGGGVPLVVLSAMHAVELIGRFEKPPVES